MLVCLVLLFTASDRVKAWQSKPIKQVVKYEDQVAADAALKQLSKLPPIVTPTEIWRLRTSLRDAALGKSFLLQGGDCAELFSYCAEDPIDAKLKLLLQMSLVLIWGSNKPVIRIGRIAGQYAKPRSSPTEMVGGKEVPSFRGDILNGYEPDQRRVDPDRLVSAYFHSATTMNYIRAQLGSGIADLHNPMDWGLGHVGDKELQSKYTAIVNSISDSLRFMRTIGADTSGQLQTVDLYSSHEGLVLEYEQSLTRRLKHPASHPGAQTSTDGKGWYNTSAHFLWIGDRTRQIDGGHVEYFRGIENPIGIKVGPSMKNDELIELLDIVHTVEDLPFPTVFAAHALCLTAAFELSLACDLLLAAGTRMTPAALAVAALAGHDHLAVAPDVGVALVLTGDEVVTSGLPGPGFVRDGFGPVLPHCVRGLGGIQGLEKILTELEEVGIVSFIDNRRGVRVQDEHPTCVLARSLRSGRWRSGRRTA